MQAQIPEHDLSVVETCALLGITAPTVYKLMGRGELDSYKVGARRRITAESLQKLRRGESQPKTPRR